MNPRFLCAMWIVGLLCVPGAAWGQSTTPDATRAVDTLPATIPIFPLGDVVLFPDTSRPLQIFEPRYLAMVADALKGDRVIGMVLLRPGYEAAYEGRPPVYPIGCAGAITDVKELPDGRYLIMLRGLVKFRVNSEDQSHAYRLARVETIPEAPTDEDRVALRQWRLRLEALLAPAVPSRTDPPPSALSDEDLVNMLAQNLDIEPLARQDLLERKGLLARSEALIELLKLKAAPRR